jgi:tyrosine-specific transport protein
MSQKPGSLIGGILLVTGSCVGAGMLGLPILTGLAGFYPALIMFFFVWLFMVATSFLLVEVNGWFPRRVNFLSMAEHSLGKWGKAFCWITYLFLFYALLVAYISASGSLVSTFLQNIHWASAPSWMGSAFLVFLFGGIVYAGTKHVDVWNRFLMVGKIVFFLALVGSSIMFVRPHLLMQANPSVAFFSLPILITSFGFHNMVPSLTTYMKGDIKRVRKAILGGSLFAFFIYLVWEILVLGIVPLQGPGGLLESYRMDREGSQALSVVLQSPAPQILAQGLGFLAILTSFLAQALGLVHFLSDGFKIAHQKQENAYLCALALIPPLLLSIFSPNLFFQALNFAGGICAVLLFGVLPVLMVWIGRYKKNVGSSYKMLGGKGALIAIFSFAVAIFVLELATLFGYLSIARWL